jgi:hypothetical protein
MGYPFTSRDDYLTLSKSVLLTWHAFLLIRSSVSLHPSYFRVSSTLSTLNLIARGISARLRRPVFASPGQAHPAWLWLDVTPGFGR